MYILFGYFASFLFSILFLPQLIKIVNTKQVKNISILFICINITANSCNIVFAVGLWMNGLMKESLPILSGCSIAFIWSILLLVLKIIYADNKHLPPVLGKKNLKLNDDNVPQGQ